MKKTILAVVTSTLLAASANAATVYDKDGEQLGIYGDLRYQAGQIGSKTNSGEADNFGGAGRTRLGVDGKMATGYGDTALIGKMEWELASESNASAGDSGTAVTARYAWLGADYGNGVQTTVGRLQNPFSELSDVTDTYNTYSGSAEYGVGYLDDGTGTNSKVYSFSDIWDDAAKVTYSADGWDLRAAYSVEDSQKDNTTNTEDKYKYATAAGYTVAIDDLSSMKVVAAYQAKAGENAGFDYDMSLASVGAGYTYDAFYFGVTYGQQKLSYDATGFSDLKSNVFAATAQYKVLPEWTLTLGYGLQDGHNVKDTTGWAASAIDNQAAQYYVFGTQYDLTKHAKAYAEYKLNQTAGDEDNYVVGLEYTF